MSENITSAPSTVSAASSAEVPGISERAARPRTTGPAAGRARRSGRAALSPSRAKDFMQCPLMFRLRTVDRLPEPGSLATHKGTLVHGILERLYDLPARERTRRAALSMLPSQWEAHREKNPVVMSLFEDPAAVGPWLGEAESLIDSYFRMENPMRLEPAERELFIQTETGDGLLLRGFIDRLDVAPDGAMRVVDYKTGRSPGPRFQSEALFQMRFYALALWRARGRAPRRLQLLYLRDGRTLTHDPRPPELEATETKVARIWDEVEECATTGEFVPRRSRLCGWCAYQTQCPIFGGTTPPLPREGLERLLTARRCTAA